MVAERLKVLKGLCSRIEDTRVIVEVVFVVTNSCSRSANDTGLGADGGADVSTDRPIGLCDRLAKDLEEEDAIALLLLRIVGCEVVVALLLHSFLFLCRGSPEVVDRAIPLDSVGLVVVLKGRTTAPAAAIAEDKVSVRSRELCDTNVACGASLLIVTTEPLEELDLGGSYDRDQSLELALQGGGNACHLG